MNGDLLLGVDIGGTKTAVLFSREPPAVLARHAFATEPQRGAAYALGLVRAGADKLLSEHGMERTAIKRIGVSCGGPLDRVRGIIQSPPNLPTWDDVPIKKILEEEFHAPCQLENDANAGAVAEHRFGGGKGTENMVFVTMGTGLGAGIIVDGRLYHGTNDLAGELGHVRLTRSGPIGHNKAGSAEGWASGGGLAQYAARVVAEAIEKGEKTVLSDLFLREKALTARDVGLAAQDGDRLALKIIRFTGRRLGEILAIVVDLLNPERIVVGGLALRLGDLLLDPARKVIRREALALSAKTCQVVPALLGEEIGDVAALSIAMGI